jgi:hypothetical protein
MTVSAMEFVFSEVLERKKRIWKVILACKLLCSGHFKKKVLQVIKKSDFLIKGALLLKILSITLGLCICKMHIAIQQYETVITV